MARVPGRRKSPKVHTRASCSIPSRASGGSTRTEGAVGRIFLTRHVPKRTLQDRAGVRVRNVRAHVCQAPTVDVTTDFTFTARHSWVIRSGSPHFDRGPCALVPTGVLCAVWGARKTRCEGRGRDGDDGDLKDHYQCRLVVTETVSSGELLARLRNEKQPRLSPTSTHISHHRTAPEDGHWCPVSSQGGQHPPLKLSTPNPNPQPSYVLDPSP